MGEVSREELPLPSLFERGRKIHQIATESGCDPDAVRKGCEVLEKCEDMVGKLGLFSSNETKDDISTANLKYILVPYFLGELIEKIAQDDRLQILKASQAKLKEFISFCEIMELVPEEELEAVAQAKPTAFTDQRARKIARFKRQRAAESKLQEIKERKERRGRSTRAAAPSAPVEAGEEDVLDDDGEEEREGGEEEFSEVVLDERSKKAESWHRDAAIRAQYTKPAQPITCATFAQDVLEGRAKVSQAHEHKHQPMIFGPASLVGGGLTSERERLAAQVFQPMHRLPTMSIEEAGLKEMEMMNKWQERNVKLMEEANSAWYKDNRKLGTSENDNEDDDDDAVQKARAFDDWKDDNPRGAGNKKLTPCG
ncbi:PP2A regulatory subunit TAP46 [Citrus sinensis]|nr:PP2A regulatory subunit TAP46 [Citrus sinensis]